MDEPRVFSPSSVDDGSNVVGSGKFSGDLPPLSSFGMHDPGTVRGSSHSDVATRNDTVNDVSDGKPPEMRRNSSKFDNTKNTTVSRTELCNGILVRLKSASTADADELSESRRRRSVLSDISTKKLTKFQGCEAMRIVRHTGKVTGFEYAIINNCVWMVSAIIHTAIFTILFVVSYWNTVLFSPTSKKSVAIACIVISWCICTLEICLTGVYCLTQMKHPLVRTRGTLYIGMTTLGLYTAASFLSLIALNYLGVIRTSIDVSLVLRVIMTSFAILVIGAQAAKQRLLYLLFEVRMNPSSMINIQSYLVVMLWISIVAAALFIAGLPNMLEHVFMIDVIMNMGFYCMLLVVAYYTYKSRYVTLAFNDWRANIIVAVMMAAVTTFVFILSNTVFKISGQPSPQNPPDLGSCFATVFAFHGIVCLSTTMLFAQIAWIAYHGLDVGKELNPANTFSSRHSMAEVACSTGGAIISSIVEGNTLSSASRTSCMV